MGVLSKVILIAWCCCGLRGMREAARRLFFENPEYQVKTIELQNGRHFAA